MMNLSYNLSAELKENLQKVETLRRVILLTPISSQFKLRFRWEAMLERIYWSLSDKSISKKDLIGLFTKQEKKNLTEIEKELLNYKKALDYISQNWLVSRKAVTLKTILTLHEIACRQTLRKSIGNLFRINEVPLRQIMDYIQTGTEHAVIQSGIAYIQVVNISPFTEGNRRVGRLLSYLFLYKSGYDFDRYLVLERFLGEDKEVVAKHMQEAIRSRNLTVWLEYFSRELTTQLEKIKADLESVRFRIELPVFFLQLNERQKTILTWLEQPDISLTNRDVQKRYKVSQITASRDLVKLVNLGLLYPHGKGRSVSYTKA